MIGSNHILHDRTLKTTSRTKTMQSYQLCNNTCSICCKYLNYSSDTFTSLITNKTYNIYRKTNF